MGRRNLQGSQSRRTCSLDSFPTATALRRSSTISRPWLDLYKVDLKSFDDRHYHELGGRIGPILDSIRRIHSMGLWLEIVTLLIPGFNDSDDELRKLTEFVAGVSPDIPWHVTAFHGDYKMQGEPAQHHARRSAARRRDRPRRRPALHLRRKSAWHGRRAWEDTRCPQCSETLIRRYGYLIEDYSLTPDGRCPHCSCQIPGRWAPDSTVKSPPALSCRTSAPVYLQSQVVDRSQKVVDI